MTPVPMTPIQVVGIGLDGAAGLTQATQQIIQQAALLVGSERHLSYFPDHTAPKLALTHFRTAIDTIRQRLHDPAVLAGEPDLSHPIVILASGDPLFFGFGRLLLAELPADWLTFHPHLSAMQLAFSRIKLPWQDARLISAHGRSLDELSQALQQGIEKIAVLTDHHNTPAVIARLLLDLELSSPYQLWVCENLGSSEEQVQCFTADALLKEGPAPLFAPLNVVVLLRLQDSVRQPLNLNRLPLLGIADQQFLSFSDRPGLMTKREIRILALGELALQPEQIIWDIGAGTGSVAIEMARLCPNSCVYAIEQTAIGISLIQQNCQRFQVTTVVPVAGVAPDALANLPDPDRVFIGGSGGKLAPILECCSQRLRPQGVIVLALATLEHLTAALHWLSGQPQYQHQLLQVQLARSVPVASLTRFSPLNPVTLLTIRPVSPTTRLRYPSA
jgi:precorrin-6B C5,15-methyltransferase / cobalt-precorrin-6B C5,C15-methyltransferase